MGKRRLYRTQSLIELAAALAVVIVVNALASFYYMRFDLTSEKRYTLSETSKKLAGRVKEKLYFKLYLDGEMSSKFKQLRNEIRDIAYEFREASGNKIEIEVVDPLAGKAKSEVAKILESFAERGLEPKRDMDTEEGDQTRIKYLIPGADFIYKDKTIPANFFEFDVSNDIETNIKRAIDNIEYEIANALRQCVSEKKMRIALADGSGEMLDERVASFAKEITRYYDVEALNMNISDPEAGRPFLEELQKKPDSAEIILLNGLQRRLNIYDLLMVVKPLKDYSSAEMYLIDQYLMKGGKVMWMIDPVWIEMDSFRYHSSVMAMDRGFENITTALFNYGVGVNSDLVMDMYCNRIPGPEQGGSRVLVNFPYFPLFTSKGLEHIITKNIGAVKSQFPASLKIKQRENVKATPLLVSSAYSKIANAPAVVDIPSTMYQMQEKGFIKTMNAGNKISGVLLEGKFRSPLVYQKKITSLPFLQEGNSKMIVIADGDIIRNHADRKRIYETGYDPFNGVTFANKKFLLNCVDYLIDDNGLIEIRGRETTMRLLDQVKAKEEKTYWQLLNTMLPISLVLIFGIANYYIRKSKYTH
jgi:gliding-associated putative ABC transporter substrate-binding component GldG